MNTNSLSQGRALELFVPIVGSLNKSPFYDRVTVKLTRKLSSRLFTHLLLHFAASVSTWSLFTLRLQAASLPQRFFVGFQNKPTLIQVYMAWPTPKPSSCKKVYIRRAQAHIMHWNNPLIFWYSIILKSGYLR